MPEDPISVAESLREEERIEMIASAGLLARRLNSLIEHGEEYRNYDFPTIVSMLGRMRDSIEAYRSAKAVHRALVEAAALAQRPADREASS